MVDLQVAHNRTSCRSSAAGFSLYAHDISNEWLVSYKVVLTVFLSTMQCIQSPTLSSRMTYYPSKLSTSPEKNSIVSPVFTLFHKKNAEQTPDWELLRLICRRCCTLCDVTKGTVVRIKTLDLLLLLNIGAENFAQPDTPLKCSLMLDIQDC